MRINSISFKGTFCLNQNDLNQRKMKKILDKTDELCLSFETGSYGNSNKLFIHTLDEIDSKLMNFLNEIKLPFIRVSEEEALDLENIKNRIVINENMEAENSLLIEVNVADLDKELRKYHYAYVCNDIVKGIGGRYDRFKKFLKTNQNIHSSIIYLRREQNGEISTHIYDGNHRFAVMRDIGMTTIPVTIDKESLELAKEIGLVKSEL